MAETIVKVLALAVLQGLTEFLPVSSSGHLVLGEHFLGLQSPGVLLEVALHLGTLGAILVFYRRRLLEMAVGACRMERAVMRDIGVILLGTIPAGVMGVLCQDSIEAAFDAPFQVCIFLCVTGVLLLSTYWVRPVSCASPGPLQALGIGFAQAAAILPGISRSGSTIVAARHMGISGEKAAEFSFLMAIPVLAGSGVLEIAKVARHGAVTELPLWLLSVGALVAGFVGYASMRWLIRALSTGRFFWFGVYCVIAGGGMMVLLRAIR